MKISPELQDSLQKTHANLRDVGQRRQALIDVLNTLGATVERERLVEGQLSSMDEADRATMDSWAKDGAKGAHPKLDHVGREALNRELVEAQAASKAAAAAAQPIRDQVDQLHQEMAAAASDLNVHSMAALASQAADVGSAYRQALIEVERRRTQLLTLDRFISARQDLSDMRTTAFLPIIQPHLQQQDLFLQPIKDREESLANQLWNELWYQCQKAPE